MKNKIKNSLAFFSLLFFTAVFLCGCAARLPLDVCPGYSFDINGAKYLPLIKICEHEGISWDYDSVSQAVTLTKDDVTAKLMVGSPLVFIMGKTEDLGRLVQIYKGALSVPYSFQYNIIKKFFKAELASRGEIPVGLKIKKICLDAGHGGKDPGAIGRTYGLREKNINLDIVMRMRKELKARGIEVVMTRNSDVFIPLNKRADIANRSSVDLFISVHTNASKSRKLSGFEIYYIADNADDSARALELAEEKIPFVNGKAELGVKDFNMDSFSKNTRAILWDLIITQSRYESAKLAGYICRAYADEAGVKVLGVKGARFAVLRQTQMPAVLAEIGFISNAAEEKCLKNSFYRQQIAEALVKGILSYGKN